MRVEEHTINLGDSPVFFRTGGPESAPPTEDPPGGDAELQPPGGDADLQPPGRDAELQPPGEMLVTVAAYPESPIVYVHGAPTSSDDWVPFLERSGGIAPDMIGFGRTGKGAQLDYSPEGLADFLGRFLAELEIGQLKLVLHGWGAAAGVLLAAQDPARVDRLVLINPVPILDGVRWPWWARLWRTRAVGELVMGFTSRMVLRRGLRRGAASPTAWSAERFGQVWEQFDQGTQRAILRLIRSVDDEQVRIMAQALRSLDLPSLVIWGERDPWWGPEVADAFAALLPQAKTARVSEAGHWPWLDDPSVVDLVMAFV